MVSKQRTKRKREVSDDEGDAKQQEVATKKLRLTYAHCDAAEIAHMRKTYNIGSDTMAVVARMVQLGTKCFAITYYDDSCVRYNADRTEMYLFQNADSIAGVCVETKASATVELHAIVVTDNKSGTLLETANSTDTTHTFSGITKESPRYHMRRDYMGLVVRSSEPIVSGKVLCTLLSGDVRGQLLNNEMSEEEKPPLELMEECAEIMGKLSLSKAE